MLYALVSFSDQIGPLNVFRYITFRTGGAIMTALLFVFLFGPAIIDLLRVKQGKGQPIREDGPATHFAKKGTPTMGGLMILSGVTVVDAAVGQLGQLVRVDRAVRDALLRRHRLLRRLPQGHQEQRPAASPASCGCWPRSSSPAVAAWAVMRVGSAGFSSSLTVPFFKNVVHAARRRCSCCSASS